MTARGNPQRSSPAVGPGDDLSRTRGPGRWWGRAVLTFY